MLNASSICSSSRSMFTLFIISNSSSRSLKSTLSRGIGSFGELGLEFVSNGASLFLLLDLIYKL